MATAASRRAIEAEQGRSVEETCCSDDGTEQRSTGRARDALMAGSGHSDGTGSGRAQRAALPWPKQRSRVRGERRERKKERERGLTKIFSKFSIDTRKTLNTKVVHHLKPYHFGFRQNFI